MSMHKKHKKKQKMKKVRNVHPVFITDLSLWLVCDSDSGQEEKNNQRVNETSQGSSPPCKHPLLNFIAKALHVLLKQSCNT
jgi:hypothetical protein